MIKPVTLAAGPVPGPLVAAPLAVPQARHQPHVSAGAELVAASPLTRLPLKPEHSHLNVITSSLMICVTHLR